MALDEKLADFIGRIYENAHHERSWDVVADGLIEFTQSRAVLVTLIDARTCDTSFSKGFGPDDSTFLDGIDDLRTHRFAEDPSLAFARENPLARYCDTRSLGEFDAEYLAWYHHHFRTDYWLVGYTPERDGLTFGVSIHQQLGKAQAASTKGLFPLLFEHIVRAAHLAARAAGISETRPVAMLDNGGRIAESSPAADTLLRAGTTATVRDGRIVVAHPEQQRDFDRLVASALGATVGGTLGGAMLLQARAGAPGCFVKVSPWPQRSSLSGIIAPRARVEFVDLGGDDDAFASPGFPFALTRREAQVARLLIQGHSLHSLAECLKISYNTARVHLHALFEKTGVNRQADLVRVLMLVSR